MSDIVEQYSGTTSRIENCQMLSLVHCGNGDIKLPPAPATTYAARQNHELQLQYEL